MSQVSSFEIDLKVSEGEIKNSTIKPDNSKVVSKGPESCDKIMIKMPNIHIYYGTTLLHNKVTLTVISKLSAFS